MLSMEMAVTASGSATKMQTHCAIIFYLHNVVTMAWHFATAVVRVEMMGMRSKTLGALEHDAIQSRREPLL
jgi:hypothetical protein